ncbi:hypothetical protein [Colwellia sp. Bg11-28]|uniref:hypothetical protein n=1 Tax=Colwellia sp. Bg11-28 TaxID=2058305 RepID=UPI000C31F14A|nr:hypothetical protein [Colwellia sp. Bg11-28]PKH87899.1 hypothetical protein CXF79_14870 [Colwellia sp. Bg11-28]
MNTLNRYIANQRAYVTEKQKQPLTGFTNQKSEQATWVDIAITFTNSQGIKVNFLFNNQNQPNARFGSTLTQDDRLDAKTHHLLIAYTLDVLKEKTTNGHKKEKVSTAKRFLSALDDNVSSASLDETQAAIDSMKYSAPLSFFFAWLHQHKMIPASCSPSITKTVNIIRSKSGDDALEAEQSKIPDEKALLALGAIFKDIIPPYVNIDDKSDISTWQALIHVTQHHRDSFTCTMAALAMASPNRVAAEQILLTKQRLQSHTEEVDGKDKTVYYLNWRGSKGFKDYQNHINAEMAESIDRALQYTAMTTEPARALARFYMKPSLALKDVLGDFQPSTENMTALIPAMNKPTNLIHLGLLLDFFDGTDKCMRVTADTKGAIGVSSGNQFPIFIKPIVELSAFDKLIFMSHCPYARSLTGSNWISKQQSEKFTAGKKELTVAEFQNHTIAMNQYNITGYNKTYRKRVDYENALFTYTDYQLNSQTGSPFILKPIASLGNIFASDCKRNNGKTVKSIFERHGFSSNFAITPHQLRHWQNDYLAKKGLPHQLITMLSGRKCAEQTLTYIHTTDAQNSSVISDILYHEEAEEAEEEVQEKVGMRLQSKQQYDAATDNLSPTFVHETGFCVQNLTLSPCTYMTEFMTQCALCPSSCHIAHDSKAIELLKKDLQVQMHNLEQVQGAINFETSSGMQEWYETHYKNTSMIKNLIEVLSDKSIKEGSIVRFLTRSNVMRITDLKTKTVTENKLSLPNSKEALQAAIEAKAKPANDSAKNNFLGFLGTI